jgi:hypothetical protein
MNRAVYSGAVPALVLLCCIAPAAIGQQFARTEVIGGSGGRSFSEPELPEGARVMEVRVRSGEFVDSVQMVYMLAGGRTETGPRRGGSGGRNSSFRLDSDEYITGISGRYGDLIDSLRIHTNKRTSPLFGGRGGERDYRIDVPAGYQAIGFAGRSGSYLDAIGLAYIPIDTRTTQTRIEGGRGGSPFADQDIPERARISEVRVRTGDLVDSIQLVYTLPDGRRVEGARHGGRGGRTQVFRLQADEYITGLSGRYGDYIDSLRIHTNRRTSPLFGGRGGNRNYRIDVPSGNQAVGLAGRAGSFLDAVGLTYKPLGSRSRRRRYRPETDSIFRSDLVLKLLSIGT